MNVCNEYKEKVCLFEMSRHEEKKNELDKAEGICIRKTSVTGLFSEMTRVSPQE